MIAYLISLCLISQSSPGLEYMRLGVGSRASALGNAYTALADEPFGIFYNPAGISGLKDPEFSCFLGRWFLDTEVGSLAGAVALGTSGVIGFGLRGLFSGSIEQRAENDPWNVGSYSAYFINPNVTWGYRIRNLGLGVGLNAITDKIESATATSGSASAGATYTTKYLQAGLSVMNLGPKIGRTASPMTARFGLCAKPIDRVHLCVDAIKPLSSDLSFYAGVEVIPVDMLRLRLGYNADVESRGGIARLCTGLGLAINRFSVQYTFASYGFLGPVHLFTLSYSLRKPAVKPESGLLEKERMMSEAYVNQGIKYYNESKLEEALTAWDFALIWQPDNQDALAWIDRVQKEQWTQSVTLFVTDGKQRYLAGDYLAAIVNFEQALGLDSTLTEVRSMKAEAERRIKEGVSAGVKEKIEQGLAIYKTGDYLRAVGVWNEILKLEPGNITVQNYVNEANQKMIDDIKAGLAQLTKHINQGSLKSAADLVNRLLKKYPNQENLTKQKIFIDQKITETVNQRLSEGRRLMAASNYTAAEKEFQKVLEYQPKNTQALSNLETIRKKTTTGSQADADRYYLQGIDAYTKNNFELAIDYWEKAIAINPSYPNAKENLQRAKIKLTELNK